MVMAALAASWILHWKRLSGIIQLINYGRDGDPVVIDLYGIVMPRLVVGKIL